MSEAEPDDSGSVLDHRLRYPSYFDWLAEIELAASDLAWAETQVRKLRTPRVTIHEELCRRLAAKEIQPPSRTVFYRWASAICRTFPRPVEARFLRQPEPLDLLRPETRALAVAALRAMIEDLELSRPPLIGKQSEEGGSDDR